MKKFLMAAIVATISFGNIGMTWAAKESSCHFHGNKEAAPETVSNCAMQRKATLIEKGKIAESWQTIPQEKIAQIDGKKGKEWLVIFRDPDAKDTAKETLYMFFTLTGNFIAANFTGN